MVFFLGPSVAVMNSGETFAHSVCSGCPSLYIAYALIHIIFRNPYNQKPHTSFPNSSYLYMPRLLVNYKVSNEQAFILTLYEPVVTLSRTSGSSTGCTDRACFLTYQRRSTGALCLLEIEERAVPCVE